MKKYGWQTVLLTIMLGLGMAGCGDGGDGDGKHLVGRSPEQFQSSYRKIIAQMPEEERSAFEAAVQKVIMIYIQFHNGAGLRGEEARNKALTALDGLTPAEVIAKAAGLIPLGN